MKQAWVALSVPNANDTDASLDLSRSAIDLLADVPVQTHHARRLSV